MSMASDPAASPHVFGQGAPRPPAPRRRFFRMPLQFRPRPAPGDARQKGQFIANMVKASGQIVSPYRFRFRTFRAKVPLQVEVKNFIVKTVDSAADLEKILRLRYKVFYSEYCERKRLFAIDVDEFDVICDHLMIIDTKTRACVGTYRLNCSLFNNRFYSETEFGIAPITALPGVKLELGRACVLKEYRRGITLALLWRGMSEYIKLTQTQYLFGCSSVKTIDPLEIAVVRRYLQRYACAPALQVAPHEPHLVKGLSLYAALADTLDEKIIAEHAKKMVPSLLQSYLKAGAVICGDPALDEDFHCVDFFTLLDLRQTTDAIERKFL
jgi:putative hemolysin